MKKTELVNALARRYQATSYLEICTPFTGHQYGEIDPALFRIRRRLMYRCPESFVDGLPVDFRSDSDSSYATVRQLAEAGIRFDLIFVDPYHTYRESLTDLYGAMRLLTPDGVMVVHDCNPPDAAVAAVEFGGPGTAWSGLTYAAFIDFVSGSSRYQYCTVDTDYGCGVVFKRPSPVPGCCRHFELPEELALDWALARCDHETRFALFERNRAALLNLVSVERFAEQAQIAMHAPKPAPRQQTKFPQSRLAHKLCLGSGVEIGGSAHNAFGLNTRNVDFTRELTVFKREEIELCGEYLPVDIEAPGDLLPLPDGSQDFVISSHVIEHFEDPIKALLEWHRVVRPGGVIFTIAPHKERTFDAGRPRTTLQELIDRHSGKRKAEGAAHSHFSVWITEDFVELIEYMNRAALFPAPVSIVAVQDVDDKVGNGFTVVLRKAA
ncbi:MAG: methyltransferase domain-containing protein [Nevskia sp.]|nr:methyltransferase domain-containing protein [Nevskia sp.]